MCWYVRRDAFSIVIVHVLSQNRYQIELLSNLDLVPEYGAMMVAAWPTPRGGFEFPARFFTLSA